MSGIQINLVVGSAFLFIGYLLGRCVELFGKGGLLDLRRQLAAEKIEVDRLRGMLFEANQEVSPSAMRIARSIDSMNEWANNAAKSFGELGSIFKTEPFVAGAGEGERTSVEQSSTRLPSPAEELRDAATIERAEWDDSENERLYPKSRLIHLAVAELLDNIADDMDAENAFIQMATDGKTIYRTVRGADLGTRYDWTSALKCARHINGDTE